MKDLVAIFGLVFGVIGTTLGVLNYLRDRAKVIVSLQWDMSVTPGTVYDPEKKWGIIRVSNVGRRPIFVSHVALRLPKGMAASHLVIQSGIEGKRLGEGDPVFTHLVSQDEMPEFKAKWRKIVAQVTDSSGKVWSSPQVPKKPIPSWAQ
jgi:hypothetical protein